MYMYMYVYMYMYMCMYYLQNQGFPIRLPKLKVYWSYKLYYNKYYNIFSTAILLRSNFFGRRFC